MSEMNITARLNFEALLKEPLDKIREGVRHELERYAGEIITQEMAKFTIDLARIVSFQDFRDQLVITIKKEIA